MYILSILSQAGKYKETQETDTQGEGHVITETETGMSHLQAKELQGLCNQPKPEGAEKSSFQNLQREHVPADTNFSLPDSRIPREHISVV